jgi:hypothetical protein
MLEGRGEGQPNAAARPADGWPFKGRIFMYPCRFPNYYPLSVCSIMGSTHCMYSTYCTVLNILLRTYYIHTYYLELVNL